MPRYASEAEIQETEFKVYGSDRPIIFRNGFWKNGSTTIPPTTEDFHLGRARAAYLEGRIDLERFEELADHVIRKDGYLSENLEPR